MNPNAGITKIAKNFLVIALSVLLSQSVFATSAMATENQQMTFEGTLTDTSGNPLDLAGATLNFYVSANGCYLYGETTTTAGDGQGNILHRFGSGTLDAGSPNTFSPNLFFGSVTGTTTFAGNNCSVSASDVRLAQVYYPAQNITGTIKLGTVPYAANATMLDGKTSTDFVLTSTDTNTLLYGGSAGQYLTKNASGLTWTTSSLTASQVQTALGYTPLDYDTLANYSLSTNNLSDLSSATQARANLGLGSLATQSFIDLTNNVSGVLPAINGGSKWSTNLTSIYSLNNVSIGSSTAYSNIGLHVKAPSGVSFPLAASIYNDAADGLGLKIRVNNNNSSYFGLKVSSLNGLNFAVYNNGSVSIGAVSATAKLHLTSGTSTMAPLKMTGGALLTTPEAGAIEFDGYYLYHTDNSGVRRVITTGNNNSSLDSVISINSNSSAITLSSPSGIIVSSTSASTGPQNGALIVKGGLGVAGSGNFGGTINAGGNISTSGSVIANGGISTTNMISAGSIIAPMIYGSTASGASLMIDSTSHANKGNIILAGNGGNIGVGTAPAYKFHIRASQPNIYNFVYSASSGTAMIGTAEHDNGQIYNVGFDTSGSPRWFFVTSGTNYINNNVSIGNALEIPNNRLSVHGNMTVTGHIVVSGSVKMAGDGADTNVTCATADEGKQRYNAGLKTMEYCDGSYWQGVSGITHCASNGSGIAYTLVGTPGTGSAFCMSKNTETATTYVNAATTCLNRSTTRNGARPYLCSEINYQMACRQYTLYGAQAETNLPGFKSTDYWIPAAYTDLSMFTLRFTTTTTAVCNVNDMTNNYSGKTNSQNYRCCYN